MMWFTWEVSNNEWTCSADNPSLELIGRYRQPTLKNQCNINILFMYEQWYLQEQKKDEHIAHGACKGLPWKWDCGTAEKTQCADIHLWSPEQYFNASYWHGQWFLMRHGEFKSANALPKLIPASDHYIVCYMRKFETVSPGAKNKVTRLNLIKTFGTCWRVHFLCDFLCNSLECWGKKLCVSQGKR